MSPTAVALTILVVTLAAVVTIAFIRLVVGK